MTKILLSGCSFTKGTGLIHEHLNENLWANKLVTKCYPNPTINNIAQAGRNNHWIFTETLSELAKHDYDVVIVAWTNVDRLNIDVGLELYKTLSMLHGPLQINLANQVVTAKWLEDTGDRIRKIQNSHWGILDLIKYVNILVNYQVVNRKSNIFFVNSLCGWSPGYFNKVNYNVPSDLGEYYLDILNVKNRDDSDIKKLYEYIHQQYQSYGGILPNYWLNLYSSLMDMQIDVASETDSHPGYKSQARYVEYLYSVLKEKI